MSIIAALLQRHRAFALLEDVELAQIETISSLVNFPAHATVVSPEIDDHYLYLIKDGRLSLRQQMREVREFHPGELFGEIGLFADQRRSGTVIAEVASTLIQIDGVALYDEDRVDVRTALKITRALTRRITDYLRRREQLTTRSLILEGESEFVEFKSTLRYNVNTGKNDARVQLAVIKTIAAFLNGKGGTLLVGIDDDGQALGLEHESFSSHDKLRLHLTNIIKSQIGELHLAYIHPSIVRVDGKDALRVDVEPADEPAYVSINSDEHFYVRTGPSTTSLSLRHVYDYVHRRFYHG